MSKRVFSGIQPTGQGHIGNYIGALRNWVRLQDEHEAFYCIVDLHAMTMPWDPKVLRRHTTEKAAELLACGVDPDRSVLFVQSHVPDHAELQWVLTCVARMGELRRMVQFKDRSRGESESVGVGLFTYPVLQAADVLLYQAHGVPVGEDQRQHVELMRDLAQRFNSNFGVTFTLPEAWIPEVGARIMALDDPTQKMSKSDMETRPSSGLMLTEDPASLTKKIKSAKTDSGTEVRAGDGKPELTNLLTIFSAIEGVPVPELETRFAGSGYGAFKAALADAVVAALEPIRLRYEELMGDPGELDRMLFKGAEKAAAVAAPTMDAVRERTGLGPRAVLTPQ
ncbi:MAG: tryptophan--tRNA ligase [Actinobacteria bacterium]|nr:tryptophan--tRNA ligase [Actinomycetota bacterium]